MANSRADAISDMQFHRLVYSAWDFEQAEAALTFLIEDCPLKQETSRSEKLRCRCYETQAIIAFGRPFEASRNGVQLSLRKAGIQLTSAERTLKDRLLYLRRKVFAHSDVEEMYYQIDERVIPLGSEETEAMRIRMPWFYFDNGMDLSEAERQEFQNLLQKLLEGIVSFILELCDDHPTRYPLHKRSESKRK